jgi:hypothetical protein
MARQFDRSRDENRQHWRDDQWRNDQWRNEDSRSGQFGRGQERPRDDQGRFMSEDDDRGDYYGQPGEYYGQRGEYYGQRGNERDWNAGGGGAGDDYSRGGRDRHDDDFPHGGAGRRVAGGNYRQGNYREDEYARSGSGRGFDQPRDEYGRFTEDERGQRRGANEYGRWQDDDYERDSYRAYEADPGRESYDDDSYRRDRSYETGRGMQGRDDWERGGQDSRGRFDDRDDRGRFESRGGSGQRGSQGRGSQGRGSQGRGSEGREYQGRESQGRGPEGRGSQGRDRQDDHRGWFGDPRGHAAAARLGWRHRQH